MLVRVRVRRLLTGAGKALGTVTIPLVASCLPAVDEFTAEEAVVVRAPCCGVVGMWLPTPNYPSACQRPTNVGVFETLFVWWRRHTANESDARGGSTAVERNRRGAWPVTSRCPSSLPSKESVESTTSAARRAGSSSRTSSSSQCTAEDGVGQGPPSPYPLLEERSPRMT